MLLKELRGKFDFYNTSQGEKGKFESISQRLKDGKIIVSFFSFKNYFEKDEKYKTQNFYNSIFQKKN